VQRSTILDEQSTVNMDHSAHNMCHSCRVPHQQRISHHQRPPLKLNHQFPPQAKGTIVSNHPIHHFDDWVEPLQKHVSLDKNNQKNQRTSGRTPLQEDPVHLLVSDGLHDFPPKRSTDHEHYTNFYARSSHPQWVLCLPTHYQAL